MNPGRHLVRPLVLALAALGSTAGAHAAQVLVTVNVENLAPANSVTFAPLHVGFHGGTFDSFDLGEAATAGIISVAEGGSGAAWFPAFMAADPGGVLGSVAGPLFQGGLGLERVHRRHDRQSLFQLRIDGRAEQRFFRGQRRPAQISPLR
jgi:hypothetical protein